MNPQIVTHIIEQFSGQEGIYPLLPILASGFGGLVMEHLCCYESLNSHGFGFLIVQEGAEPFPVMYPPLPVLVPGCGKLGRGLLYLSSWDWGAQRIMSPKSSPMLLSISIIWEETELFPVMYLLSFLELRDLEGNVGIWGVGSGSL